VNPFPNNVTIPLNGHLLFASIRNNTALDEDATKTTLTMNGNDSGTKIGTASTRAQGDPQILITNNGATSMHAAVASCMRNCRSRKSREIRQSFPVLCRIFPPP
jgi:hypothetical protein